MRAMFCAELAQLFKGDGGLAPVDSFRAHLYALLQIHRHACGYQRAAALSSTMSRRAPLMPVSTS